MFYMLTVNNKSQSSFERYTNTSNQSEMNLSEQNTETKINTVQLLYYYRSQGFEKA